MTVRPVHAPIRQFPVIDDALIVGGHRIEALATLAGGTPFYAYDRDAMAQRMSMLRERLPAGLVVHYAMKANPMPAVVNHLAALVDGLDVASIGELRTALASNVPAADISFAGPGKRDQELESAIVAGVTINLESVNELRRALRLGDRLGVTPQLAIRVNPDFELKGAGMKMGGGPMPFGVDAEAVPEVLRELAGSGAHFRGFQIFSGSQNLHAARLTEVQSATFALAYRLAEVGGVDVEMLNIGGGFGVPYFPGDQRLDLAPVADNLERLLPTCRARLGEVEVVLELGRYLVAEAGVYVCRVIDRKVSRGRTYLVTDGGLHHHLAASGNLGQVIRKNFPVVNAASVYEGPRETVNVVGPLCTPLDLLADRMELGSAQIGDLIAVLQSGAYGLSASPQRFLGHPEPNEILI